MNTQNNKAQAYPIIQKTVDNHIAALCKNNDMNDQTSFDYWLKKNSYYHQEVIKFFTFVIPPTASVLHVNCKNGYLLNALNPEMGVGVDMDAASIAQAQERYEKYQFHVGGIDTLSLYKPFDYIVLSLATMEVSMISSSFL